MNKKTDEQLEAAYLAGLELGATWAPRLAGFLYADPTGEKLRRGLRQDYLAWQKATFGLTSRQQLLTWRQLLARLFPTEVAAASDVAPLTKKELKHRPTKKTARQTARQATKKAPPRPAHQRATKKTAPAPTTSAAPIASGATANPVRRGLPTTRAIRLDLRATTKTSPKAAPKTTSRSPLAKKSSRPPAKFKNTK